MSNEEWDLDNAELRPPVKGHRHIVSVALLPDEFRAIAAQAKAEGMSLSGFIRDTALRNTGKPVTWVKVQDGMQISVTGAGA